MIPRRLLIPIGLALPVIAFAGCGSKPTAASGQQGLFDQHCAKCHAQAGEPGGPSVGSSKGPILAKIGAKRGRTVDWLTAYIRDPQNTEPKSKMPGFKGTLTDDEIHSLAEFLAAKK